jgi:GNAT superfamily N-acetyltransferase
LTRGSHIFSVLTDLDLRQQGQPLPLVVPSQCSKKKPSPNPLLDPPLLLELHDTFNPFFQPTIDIFQKAFPDSHEINKSEVKELLEEGLYRIFIYVAPERDSTGNGFFDGVVTAAAMLLASNGLPHFPDACHLDYFFVNPAIQGKGIGTAFMNDLLKSLQKEGKYKIMSLECYDELVKFYLRFGAKKVKVRPSQWQGHEKLYNFMVIPIGQDLKDQMKLDLLLTDIREAHEEKLEKVLDDKFVWKTAPCK